MTNFDIFLSEPKFAAFAEVAVSAEKIYQIDPAACLINPNLSSKCPLTKHSFSLTA